MSRHRSILLATLIALLLASGATRAEVPGGFTWQGRLSESGQPYDGVVDLVFTLHDGEAGGGQLGPTLTLVDHPVTAGLIIVDLDFGSGLFDGQPRWLEIAVNGATLAPRQPVMPAPYAIQALSVPAMSIVPSMFAPDAVTSVALASDPGSLSKVSGGAVSATGGDVVVGSKLSVSQTLVSDFSRSGGYLARSPGGSGAATLSLDAEADPGGGSWFLSSHADNSPFGTPGGTFSLYNGEDRLTVTANGNVGIGTAAPSERLEVAGDLKLVSGSDVSTTFGSGTLIIQKPGSISGLHIDSNEIQVLGSAGDSLRINEANLGSTRINDTLHILTSGNVGIGTNSPQSSLHVAGDARIDGSITIAATTRYATVSAMAFGLITNARYIQVNDLAPLLDSSYGINLDGFSAAAPLMLPDGAQITEMKAQVGDLSPESDRNLTVSIRRHPIGDLLAVNILASATTSGQPDGIALTDTSIADALIGNENYSYYVAATAPRDSSVYLFEVRVRYAVTSPLP